MNRNSVMQLQKPPITLYIIDELRAVFEKNLRKFQKKNHILVHIYLDILTYDCVQRSFTFTMYPGTHSSCSFGFFKNIHTFFLFSQFVRRDIGTELKLNMGTVRP